MIRVVLADDQELVRSGMRALLGKTPNVEVVGEAADGIELLRLVEELDPDVVVIDALMPSLNGFVATERLKTGSESPRIIVVSEREEERFVLRALAAGADAYLLKISSHADLVAALRTVANGHTYLCPEVSGIIVKRALMNHATQEAENTLTLRQKEVLQLLAEGHTAAQIGKTLGLSKETINAHRQNIKRILDISDMAGLARYAVRDGLIKA